jgi:hypothetical protein
MASLSRAVQRVVHRSLWVRTFVAATVASSPETVVTCSIVLRGLAYLAPIDLEHVIPLKHPPIVTRPIATGDAFPGVTKSSFMNWFKL